MCIFAMRKENLHVKLWAFLLFWNSYDGHYSSGLTWVIWTTHKQWQYSAFICCFIASKLYLRTLPHFIGQKVGSLLRKLKSWGSQGKQKGLLKGPLSARNSCHLTLALWKSEGVGGRRRQSSYKGPSPTWEQREMTGCGDMGFLYTFLCLSLVSSTAVRWAIVQREVV